MKSKDLIDIANNVRERAYSPYSNFTVGAALLCKDGTIYTGCNIENSSYSATVCAERVAFFKAIEEEHTEFDAIAICGGKKDCKGIKCPPCGICRQVMSEFCDKDFKIYLEDQGNIIEYTLEELLPESFEL